MAKERFKARIAVYLFLEKDDKILLHLRKNSGFADGLYSLVAGHLDGNEPTMQAMIREAKEEAGIDIQPEDLHVSHVMHFTEKDEYFNIFMTCKKWSGEIKNCEPNKCGELLFADKNNLPENTLECVKAALENIKEGKFFSEFGWNK